MFFEAYFIEEDQVDIGNLCIFGFKCLVSETNIKTQWDISRIETVPIKIIYGFLEHCLSRPSIKYDIWERDISP